MTLWLLYYARHYMTGGSKGGARSGDEMRTGAGQGISGFDPTLGADPIFAAAGRSEEQQQQSQRASSQVGTAAATSHLLYSICPTNLLASQSCHMTSAGVPFLLCHR